MGRVSGRGDLKEKESVVCLRWERCGGGDGSGSEREAVDASRHLPCSVPGATVMVLLALRRHRHVTAGETQSRLQYKLPLCLWCSKWLGARGWPAPEVG